MATPVDFRHLGPLADVFGTTGLDVGTVLDSDGYVPPRVILQAFRSLTPTAEVTQYVNLWERLWSDEYVSAYRAMTGWDTDHVPFPGAAARQTVQMLVRDNAMMTGRLVLGGDRVRLTDITLPFLSVLGTRDHIIPEPASAPVINLVGSADKHELRLGGGHIGSSSARPRQDHDPRDHRFPATAKRAGHMTIRQLTPADTGGLVEFFGALSERDLTFIREDVHDAHAISELPDSPDTRWVAAGAGVIKGYATVERLPGWSDHVGELRLVVRPDSRGTGIGRALAQHALSGALAAECGRWWSNWPQTRNPRSLCSPASGSRVRRCCVITSAIVTETCATSWCSRTTSTKAGPASTRSGWPTR